jgi:hypothetical protein
MSRAKWALSMSSMVGVKRFYTVKNHGARSVRAWHANRREAKYVTGTEGAAIVGTIKIDAWAKPFARSAGGAVRAFDTQACRGVYPARLGQRFHVADGEHAAGVFHHLDTGRKPGR